MSTITSARPTATKPSTDTSRSRKWAGDMSRQGDYGDARGDSADYGDARAEYGEAWGEH